mmetsp:Transcript_21168/g.44124  ORF Transcript_21168/g.44124 Transcript_21168/m.44124 type:complete len:278 (-) Transcript_21168:365-1198(-)
MPVDAEQRGQESDAPLATSIRRRRRRVHDDGRSEPPESLSEVFQREIAIAPFDLSHPPRVGAQGHEILQLGLPPPRRDEPRELAPQCLVIVRDLRLRLEVRVEVAGRIVREKEGEISTEVGAARRERLRQVIAGAARGSRSSSSSGSSRSSSREVASLPRGDGTELAQCSHPHVRVFPLVFARVFQYLLEVRPRLVPIPRLVLAVEVEIPQQRRGGRVPQCGALLVIFQCFLHGLPADFSNGGRRRRRRRRRRGDQPVVLRPTHIAHRRGVSVFRES